MSDGEQRLDGLSEDERALESRLSRLGEILSALRRAQDDMDPGFNRTLRAHLLHGEDMAPHPTFARRLRAQLLRPRGAQPVPRPRRRRLRSWLTILAAVVGIALALLSQIPRSSGFQTPYPTKADLLLNLPLAGPSISRITPTLSLARHASAVLFFGRLHLSVPRLPELPHEAPAYRLTLPSGVAGRARRQFNIDSHVHRVRVRGATWLIAADGGSSRRSIHSVAVSTATGELIYHDRRNFVLPHSARPLRDTAAVTAARHWLKTLGWPVRSMPVRDVGTVAGLRKVRQVVFGWHGVHHAAMRAATLWVTPDRSVIEAQVWPPVAASGHVRIRSPARAWMDVASRRTPVALHGFRTRLGGVLQGKVRTASAVLILVAGRHGTSYLVPAYRFAGRARLGSNARNRAWESLVPGQQK